MCFCLVDGAGNKDLFFRNIKSCRPRRATVSYHIWYAFKWRKNPRRIKLLYAYSIFEREENRIPLLQLGQPFFGIKMSLNKSL